MIGKRLKDDEIIKKLILKIILHKKISIKIIGTESERWKKIEGWIFFKKTQFYKLFQIRQIIRKRTWIKFNKWKNWRKKKLIFLYKLF